MSFYKARSADNSLKEVTSKHVLLKHLSELSPNEAAKIVTITLNVSANEDFNSYINSLMKLPVFPNVKRLYIDYEYLHMDQSIFDKFISEKIPKKAECRFYHRMASFSQDMSSYTVRLADGTLKEVTDEELFLKHLSEMSPEQAAEISTISFSIPMNDNYDSFIMSLMYLPDFPNIRAIYFVHEDEAIDKSIFDNVILCNSKFVCCGTDKYVDYWFCCATDKYDFDYQLYLRDLPDRPERYE